MLFRSSLSLSALLPAATVALTLFRIYGEKDGTTKEYHHDIAFDELGDVLDSMIETGGMTKEEYQAKVKDFVCSL